MQSRPPELLAPNRSRLFPQFETYKFQSLDPEQVVRVYPLPDGGATQSRVHHVTQHLGFKEIRSRVSWDHLETAGSRGVYVDTDWNVCGFELDVNLQPSFSKLASLPVPVSSDEYYSEFPRALALSPTLWAVASGDGSLYVLRVSEPGQPFTGEFIARHDLDSKDTNGLSPFILYAAHQVQTNEFQLLLARSIVLPADESSKYKPRRTTFELLEVNLNAAIQNNVDTKPELLSPNWTLIGDDLPYWAVWAEGGWIVLSEDPFNLPITKESDETEDERATREYQERVSKLGLGASLEPGDEPPQPPASNDMDVDASEKEYPFSWTQDTAAVSLKIQLPTGLPQTAVTVSIAPEIMAVKVDSRELSVALNGFLGKPFHSFWTEIDPSGSTWTYEPSQGILEINIRKNEEDGTRWPSVFIPDDDDSDDGDEVPETFNSSTLAAIRASFSQVQTRQGDDLQGNQPAMPGLMREEMDFDMGDDQDFGDTTEGAFGDTGTGKVGRTALTGHIVFDGAQVKSTWSRQPASVLSLPLLPAGLDLPEGAGIIVKQALDGLLFAPQAGSDPSRTPWIHLGTNPALAFVMSSKRDLRLVKHFTRLVGAGDTAAERMAATTVLAFDSGTGTGQGNVYVYYPPGSASGSAMADTKSARQGVVAVSGGDRGSLLGVGYVGIGSQEAVVALCENSLVVLSDIL